MCSGQGLGSGSRCSLTGIGELTPKHELCWAEITSWHERGMDNEGREALLEAVM